VKDTGRAIALLQVAEHLRYNTYNVASGRLTTNADVIDAIRSLQPGLNLELPQGATRLATRSTSPACTTTPATSPSTTPLVPQPTTSHGCERQQPLSPASRLAEESSVVCRHG